ncbi:UNVERIFIED_CONTAM: hypothetical protein GTU68_010288 [Idotea baltica]|nr:hypothetical protein [Idotea baltica]
MQYNHQKIEKKWQEFWATNQTFKASNTSEKPKYYVLDMFPYPSGAGLHVGHPLGYIASDIYARYKRHKGFNVLHPQGYDSFGLPAEQYAIQTGQHPAKTTEENIKTYRRQLDQIGFSFDWSREVRTSNPEYYKWTQWIFIQLFNSCLTFLSDTEVNWCPALGTVLANDEIVNGVSERGGHPVVRKKMTQWSMRISAYAQRLLDGLNKIDWPQPLKDSQTNWIGRSQGAMVSFPILTFPKGISVFTTRPDTIFGVSFMTLAPEHELVSKITTDAQKAEVEAYIEATAKRSERDRMADVKTISGAFTGAYAIHPFSGEKVQIWIGDYVLASYGTGAVMAVPCGDQRDYDFAKHFDIPIPNIFEGVDISEAAHADKEGTVIANSDFLSGLKYKKALKLAIYEIEKRGFGYGKINYRLRDAVFSRQRYWGEPFPVYYKDGMPQMIDTKHLPIVLPEVEKYLPTEGGDPPLGRAKKWYWLEYDGRLGGALELNTMPGWAGSSWYFNRYMDAGNTQEFASKKALEYWQNVDLYIGGSEHATGHLLYARFWQKFLFDRNIVPVDEFAKKLINQGMILGTSALVYIFDAEFKIKNPKTKIGFLGRTIAISREDYKKIENKNFKDLSFINKIKNFYNNEADLNLDYDLRPLEQAKPWKTSGISGVYSFLKKLYKLFYNGEHFEVSDATPTKDELKTLHKTIKKVEEDIENFSFNTSVSTFMIAVNEFTAQKCNKREILEPLLILISPYAPHIAEELWSQLGHTESISTVPFPKFDAKHLVESAKNYPISFNGKMRFTLELPLDLSKEEIEKTVMAHEKTQAQLAGRTPKKVIVVPGKIVNIVG